MKLPLRPFSLLTIILVLSVLGCEVTAKFPSGSPLGMIEIQVQFTAHCPLLYGFADIRWEGQRITEPGESPGPADMSTQSLRVEAITLNSNSCLVEFLPSEGLRAGTWSVYLTVTGGPNQEPLFSGLCQQTIAQGNTIALLFTESTSLPLGGVSCTSPFGGSAPSQ
jgi:hypothetical protein